MHFLICDLGNTLVKIALYEDDLLKKQGTIEEATEFAFGNYIEKNGFNRADAAIVSSVSHQATPYLKLINSGITLTLDEQTRLPLINAYKTPATLGNDRIAGAVGAASLYPGKDLLVIDLGTAITYDFVEKGNKYLGGGIAPGIKMRFKALNAFTRRLPLVETSADVHLIGDTTEESIRSGVMKGSMAEVTGIIAAYQHIYPELITILTGGDLIYFEKILKNNIFANPNLIFWGLKQILTYNLEK